jgi:DNA polymerase III epsilon subunit-like protein
MPDSLPNLNGNILAAVDLETTGRLAGYHEIVQIAIVPIGLDLLPIEGITPFYHTMKPEYKERAEKEAMHVSGLSLEELEAGAPESWQVQDWLHDWFRDLDLPLSRSLVPLAHNWSHEKGFLTDWLGLEGISKFFFSHPRDTMITALFLNDYCAMNGELVPFSHVNLPYLCKVLGVEHENAHDALADCYACAEVYRRLLYAFGTRGLSVPGGRGSHGTD